MAGYSGTPLVGKLGLKPGQRALLSGVPEDLPEIAAYADFALRDTMWDGVSVYDLVIIFETQRARLDAWGSMFRRLLQPDGMVWIAWPKKASRQPTTLSENVLREVLLPTGLVDVKVCAIDFVWSALKFVVRKEIRSNWSVESSQGDTR